MHLGFWDFVWGQFAKQQPVVRADLTDKTVLVLGANTGLGFEATKHFATMNPARIILACRSQSRGQAAIEKLKTDTGYANAELWIIDLADFESVKRFADKFEKDGGRLDILVENAAFAAMNGYEATKDGWEASLQVNYLATSLVALLLLPAMIKTAQDHSTSPRIVVVSSEVHYWVDIEKAVCENPGILKTLGSSEYCTPKIMENRYPVTKLLNVLFVRALNARLPPSTLLTVDTVNPGYCYSELRRGFSGVMAVVDRIMELILAFSTEVGSRQLVWAALAHQDDPEKLHGQYISAYDVREVSDFVLSAQGAKAEDHIWDEMVEILGKIDPRVTANVEKYLSYA
ncbi:hypothetical protein C8R44DRAFT_698819 [Mycena epipterygia]|nr:hypothetical protein C8R44DRAFT_698819 [Mycena epipterygia]